MVTPRWSQGAPGDGVVRLGGSLVPPGTGLVVHSVVPRDGVRALSGVSPGDEARGSVGFC